MLYYLPRWRPRRAFLRWSPRSRERPCQGRISLGCRAASVCRRCRRRWWGRLTGWATGQQCWDPEWLGLEKTWQNVSRLRLHPDTSTSQEPMQQVKLQLSAEWTSSRLCVLTVFDHFMHLLPYLEWERTHVFAHIYERSWSHNFIFNWINNTEKKENSLCHMKQRKTTFYISIDKVFFFTLPASSCISEKIEKIDANLLLYVKKNLCFYASIHALFQIWNLLTWRTEMPSKAISSSKALMDTDTDVIFRSISSILCLICRLFCSSSLRSSSILASSSTWRKLWSFWNSSWVRLSTNWAWTWNKTCIRLAWKLTSTSCVSHDFHLNVRHRVLIVFPHFVKSVPLFL